MRLVGEVLDKFILLHHLKEVRGMVWWMSGSGDFSPSGKAGKGFARFATNELRRADILINRYDKKYIENPWGIELYPFEEEPTTDTMSYDDLLKYFMSL